MEQVLDRVAMLFMFPFVADAEDDDEDDAGTDADAAAADVPDEKEPDDERDWIDDAADRDPIPLLWDPNICCCCCSCCCWCKCCSIDA